MSKNVFVRPSEFRNHINILKRRDYRFRILIDVIGNLDFSFPKWKRINDAVLYAVIGQMLSVKVANKIITRLKDDYSDSDKVIDWASKSYKKKGPIKGVSQRKRRALYEWSVYSSCIDRKKTLSMEDSEY